MVFARRPKTSRVNSECWGVFQLLAQVHGLASQKAKGQYVSIPISSVCSHRISVGPVSLPLLELTYFLNPCCAWRANHHLGAERVSALWIEQEPVTRHLYAVNSLGIVAQPALP